MESLDPSGPEEVSFAGESVDEGPAHRPGVDAGPAGDDAWHEPGPASGDSGEADAGLSPAATAALIDVASHLETLSAKQDGLRTLFETRSRADEAQAKALERLYDQLGEYKANFIRQEMQPLLRDLIYCYDYADLECTRAGRGEAPPTPREAAHAFAHLRQMVADVLSKYDVEPYRSPGPEFDRREQQCVKTVPTAVEAEAKNVAEVGAIGFRIADQIVRKEQVTVYKYATAPANVSAPEGR